MNPMDIEKNLRQLHKIEPDPAYARDLRVRLMMATPRVQRVTFQAFFTGLLRSGSAMAAVGLLLFFAVGGSIWNLVFSPATGWDSKTLLAEAQAIDTQIHLADLQYSDPGYERQRLISPKTNFHSIAIVTGPEDSSAPASTSTDPIAVSETETDVETSEDTTNSTSTPGEDPESATSTLPVDDGKVSVEDALEILSN